MQQCQFLIQSEIMTETNLEILSPETLWAGQRGERWLANVDRLEEMLEPINQALIELTACQPGEQIIDVGCGAGTTSILIAQKIGSAGAVTGLDISPVLVAKATKRAQDLGLENLNFVLGDATIAELPLAQADCLVSRFGVMFFSDPQVAFAHLHGFLKPSGRMVFACWAPLLQNLWRRELENIINSHFPLPTPIPYAPGPFAFDEPAYVQEILETAGFKDIRFSCWQHSLCIGGASSNAQSAAEFLLQAMGVAQLPEDLPAEIRIAIHHELNEKLKTFETKVGVQMPAAVWLVSAIA
jgi:SAM-dependent methyltransferase